jgi:hypothetical protein
LVRISGSGATKIPKRELYKTYGKKCPICAKHWFDHTTIGIIECHALLREEGFEHHRMAAEVMKRMGYGGSEASLRHRRKVKEFMDFYMKYTHRKGMTNKWDRVEAWKSLKHKPVTSHD